MRDNLLNFISLQKGEEDKQKVLDDVKENISFRNANLWILVCAILIASIGLNVNSTAVIIGAMLISPLMGPVVGSGFALATYDTNLLQRAIKNLLIATIVGLLVATFYFFISPFKETQSEILSRTSPNIYDILIAFLGGVVGVISLTRVDKGNPIPGVAIATALMPPLCTAGYGLAVGNFQYFAGAFYLYTINCFFICIATFFITKYLKYPPVRSVDKKHDKQIHRFITIMVFVMIIPSFYLAYDLYNEKKFSQNVTTFIDEEFNRKGHIILFQKMKYHSNPKKVELALLSKRFSQDEIDALNESLQHYGIENTQLVIKQEESDLKGEIMKEINGQGNLLTVKDRRIENLERELKFYRLDHINLKNEMNILFPEIVDFSVGRHHENVEDPKSFIVFLYHSKTSKETLDVGKLKAWLQQKFENHPVKIIRGL